jgi:hypothetical protein
VINQILQDSEKNLQVVLTNKKLNKILFMSKNISQIVNTDNNLSDQEILAELF